MRRRLPHILLNTATVVSLALCASLVVLWVRSKSRLDEVEYARAHGVVYLRSVNSCIVLSRIDSSLASTSTGWGYTSRELGWIAGLGTSGFSYTATTFATAMGTYTERSWAMPHWAAIVATLVLPMIVVVRCRLRDGRARHGHCPACGYDLRATPDRCPECGTESAAPSA
jgi:hypothetical protein